MGKEYGTWDELYRNARKVEKIKFEANERDEGELERTGQPLCIYEIYDGAGAWPFLHHGSLYRGLSLVSSFDLHYFVSIFQLILSACSIVTTNIILFEPVPEVVLRLIIFTTL